MVSGTAVWREFCITEHKQAVKHSVCGKLYFRTRSTGQNIHRLLPNNVADKCDFNIICLSN